MILGLTIIMIGWINAKDAIARGSAFDTSRDLTKNVTIVGHATQLLRPAMSTLILKYESWVSRYIWVEILLLMQCGKNWEVLILRKKYNLSKFPYTFLIRMAILFGYCYKHCLFGVGRKYE